MEYDNKRVVDELKRWEAYWKTYHLPAWNEIPNLGLYMEQVIGLMTEYLHVPKTENREESFVTAATINNYVRKKVMPKPVKKKYYRQHIAYLILIYTLKYCLSIPTLQIMIPFDLSEEETEKVYTNYVARYHEAVEFFMAYTRAVEEEMTAGRGETDSTSSTPENLIITASVFSGLARTLAEKLLQLHDRTDAEPTGQNEIAAEQTAVSP